MIAYRSRLASGTALCLILSFIPLSALAQAASDEVELDVIVLSAEDQIKQALGASNISAEDLAKTPVVNDVSEIIRKMPGVNLTGTTTSGQRGNNRQIDIRGMGPENTLILIDGKPVASRNAVRMGRAGERDSRGDSNWVAPELIERIEVLRGPAASRYGSGASGGVVNIITKRPEDQTSSVGVHFTAPSSGLEGGTRRVNMMTAGPLGERLSYRLSLNNNKTEADDPDINQPATEGDVAPAGREGVENKDLNALLTWHVADNHDIDFELGFSRQGNIFSGDRQNSGTPSDEVEDLANQGSETNTMYRRTLGVTHRGTYDFGESFSYIQFEGTQNTRNIEGTGGSGEGQINSYEKATIKLQNFSAKTEWVMPLVIGGKRQTLTLGAEFRKEVKKDATSNRASLIDGVVIDGTETDPSKRSPRTSQSILSLYAESNIEWNDQLTLTPALRLDQSSSFGANLSPSLNATYKLDDEWTMKVGVARAFKAPNLFQLDPNYVYYTMGRGCPITAPSQGGVGCYVVGDADLKAETSFNKEIGIAYEGANGLSGSLTYFHNDYKNRIAAGLKSVADANPVTGAGRILKWENTADAVVAGIEGNIAFPIGEKFDFNANFTYMTESKNKANGQPLSLIPEYTINASLDWNISDQFTVTTSATHYGKIKSNLISATTGGAETSTEPREAYTIVNLGMNYTFENDLRLSGGVTNVFDKQLLRSGEGANTFNEAGRGFYVSLNKTF